MALKAIRPEWADDPACRDLLERLTFDVLDGWDPEAIAVTMAANRADLRIFVEWARRTKPPDQYRWDLRPEMDRGERFDSMVRL